MMRRNTMKKMIAKAFALMIIGAVILTSLYINNYYAYVRIIVYLIGLIGLAKIVFGTESGKKLLLYIRGGCGH